MNWETVFNIFSIVFIALFYLAAYYPIYVMKKMVKELDVLVENGNKWPEPPLTETMGEK